MRDIANVGYHHRCGLLAAGIIRTITIERPRAVVVWAVFFRLLDLVALLVGAQSRKTTLHKVPVFRDAKLLGFAQAEPFDFVMATAKFGALRELQHSELQLGLAGDLILELNFPYDRR